MATQAQVEQKSRVIDWDELGIELDDLEAIAEIVR